MMERDMIEQLWKAGKMPDWAYYQQNGKTAIENYREQKARFAERIENDIEKQIDEKLPPFLEATISKLLDGLR